MPTPIEDKFIYWYRTMPLVRVHGDNKSHMCYTRCPMELIHGPFAEAKLCEGSTGQITPRGADLLATADAIGYDPTAKPEPAPKPATRECPGCKGKGRVSVTRRDESNDRNMVGLVKGQDGRKDDQGRVPVVVLPGWDMTCGTCKGACVVPALRVVLGFDSSIEAFMNAIEAQVSRWAAVTGMPPRVLDSTRNIVPLDGMPTTPACRKNAARRRAESILHCFVFDYLPPSERPQ